MAVIGYLMPNGETLFFDTAKHRYYLLNDNNEEINQVSVTTVTRVIDKPALMYWAIKETALAIESKLVPGMKIDEINRAEIINYGKGACKRKSNSATDIGTEVHKWLEKYIGLRMDGMSGRSLCLPANKVLRKSVKAFDKWLNNNKIDCLYAEEKLYNPLWNYAGTVDLIAEINGVLTIIDFKTSAAIYDEYWLQVAAYAAAYCELYQYDINKVQLGIVRIPKDGQLDVNKDIQFDNDVLRHLYGFIGALEIYNWQHS